MLIEYKDKLVFEREVTTTDVRAIFDLVNEFVYLGCAFCKDRRVIEKGMCREQMEWIVRQSKVRAPFLC